MSSIPTMPGFPPPPPAARRPAAAGPAQAPKAPQAPQAPQAPRGFEVITGDAFSLQATTAAAGASASAQAPTIIVIQAPQAAPPAAPPEKKGWFSAPARWLSKISKPVTKAVGWLTMAVGGGGGLAATGAFLAQAIAPQALRSVIIDLGLVGLMGPQSAALIGVGLAAAFTIGAVAFARTFLKAAKSEG